MAAAVGNTVVEILILMVDMSLMIPEGIHCQSYMVIFGQLAPLLEGLGFVSLIILAHLVFLSMISEAYPMRIGR